MSKRLDVYLYHDLVGHLIQDEHGRLSFQYVENWLTPTSAVPLSSSLPLRSERFSGKECRPFFGGLLPEQRQRELIAKNLGISARNDFAMLKEIGMDCAGAVTFVPSGAAFPERTYSYRKLSDKELADMLRTLPRRPLMAGEEGVRLSLAGAQHKMSLHVLNGSISVPLGGAPSTHILKPDLEVFEGIVFNEALCLNLARNVGLVVVNATTHNVGGIDYLMVERYDRKISPPSPALQGDLFKTQPHPMRLHQEDFCQALGIVSETKYQEEGGPSLKQCFDLVREISTAPVIDLQRMLDAVIFNILIGNHDAHGKNFSLLYDQSDTTSQGRSIRFAPLYDILTTVYYPGLSAKMAMKVGGEYKSDSISPRHMEKFAEETGLAKQLVKKRTLELAKITAGELEKNKPHNSTLKKVAVLIQDRCKTMIQRFTY